MNHRGTGYDVDTGRGERAVRLAGTLGAVVARSPCCAGCWDPRWPRRQARKRAPRRRTGSGIRRRATATQRSRPRRVISASHSRSRSRRGWCSTPRPTTAFTLYLDGKAVAAGKRLALDAERSRPSWRSARTSWRPGRRTRRRAGGLPGAAAACCRWGRGCRSIPTRAGRRPATVPAGDGWTKVGFDDSSWVRALDLGALGTGPGGRSPAAEDPAAAVPRSRGFKIERPPRPPSRARWSPSRLIPSGVPCVSIEQGPIARLIDDDQDGRYDRRAGHRRPRCGTARGSRSFAASSSRSGNGPKGDGHLPPGRLRTRTACSRSAS